MSEDKKKPDYLKLPRNRKTVPKSNIKRSRRGLKKRQYNRWEEIDESETLTPLPTLEEMDKREEESKPFFGAEEDEPPLSLSEALKKTGFWKTITGQGENKT